MEISWPGGKLAIRLWETVERIGIGICSPIQIRREGAARADVRRRERLLDAQTEREIEGIRPGASTAEALTAGQGKGERQQRAQHALASRLGYIEPRLGGAEEPRDLARLAETGLRVREIDRLIHLRAVHRIAEDLADDIADQPLTEEQPTDLWVTQWYEGASEVNEEELQQFWARLLIGEVSKPGSVSQKTMFTLRQMSSDDARLLERLGPYVIDNKFIVRAVNYLNRTNAVNWDVALKLDDLGLLSGVDNELTAGSWVVGDSNRGRAAVLRSHNGRALLLGVADGEAALMMPVIRLTDAGRQLMRLGKFTAHDEYLRAVAELSAQRWFVPNNPGTLWAVLAIGRDSGGGKMSITEEEVLFEHKPNEVGPGAAPK